MPNQLDPFNNTPPQLESVKAYGWQTAKIIVSGSVHIQFLACPVHVVLASTYLSLGQIALDPSDQSADRSDLVVDSRFMGLEKSVWHTTV